MQKQVSEEIRCEEKGKRVTTEPCFVKSETELRLFSWTFVTTGQ